MCSTAARPPSALIQWPSTNMIFWSGSPRREGTSTGRRCSCSAASAIRAARFEERTAANVATASTSVPAPVTIEETAVQSVAGINVTSVTTGPEYPARLLHRRLPG